jgi:hypothetical protein
MGFASNNPAATDDEGTRTAAAREPSDSPQPGAAAGGDGVKHGRDNSANETDDWLAGGGEEAGYGYGV